MPSRGKDVPQLHEKLQEDEEEQEGEQRPSPSDLRLWRIVFHAIAGDPGHEGGQKAQKKRAADASGEDERGDEKGGVDEGYSRRRSERQ